MSTLQSQCKDTQDRFKVVKITYQLLSNQGSTEIKQHFQAVLFERKKLKSHYFPP